MGDDSTETPALNSQEAISPALERPSELVPGTDMLEEGEKIHYGKIIFLKSKININFSRTKMWRIQNLENCQKILIQEMLPRSLQLEEENYLDLQIFGQ